QVTADVQDFDSNQESASMEKGS
ncbi:MAG: hypothetical protein RIR18_468, partial [Pseudomonadota bacterium]